MKKFYPSTLLIFIVLFSVQYSQAQTGDIYISSRGTNEVKRYNPNTGQFISNFVTANSGGLNTPQEVIFHPGDGNLIVTGRFNSDIKLYNGQTGAYMGNFSHGYSLDQPTKTTIGPDSLLYVSQWGSNKQKVVRFNLTTGAFIDEFTSVNVPNGMGHAWDEDRRMYVARWGNGSNGEIMRFDSLGILDSTFSLTNNVAGPVNVWYDSPLLYVEDWTLGTVQVWDTAGNYQGTVYSGMDSPEGFVFTPSGELYLCDWALHRVYKADPSDSSLTTFIPTAGNGNLTNPNSITFGPDPSVGVKQLQQSEASFIGVFPNPVEDKATIELDLKVPMTGELQLYSMNGQFIASLFSGEIPAGKTQFPFKRESLSSGSYLLHLKGQQKQLSEVLIIKK